MTADVLTTIFGDAVQVKLVEFFITHDENLYKLTEIAELVGVTHSRVHDLIGKLVSIRLIYETRSGRIRLFNLNNDHPIVKSLKELYRVTRAYKIAAEI
ncbi:MAG: hypothetical protein U9O98_05490 [Asgard group archaeon]|nr:hypothetical protein [Asgard group archaeon]